MQNKARKNYIIYVLMLLLFGGLIYVAIEEGDRFSHHAANTLNTLQDGPFAMFLQFMQDNLFWDFFSRKLFIFCSLSIR